MDIIKLDKNGILDFRSLIEIFSLVFEHKSPKIDSHQLNKLLSNPDFLVFVVKINNEVIGGLSIYVLHQYTNPKPLAYIYDVGIKPEFQGKGFGKSLMAEVCNYCNKNGFDAAYVEAENDDTDAINFYRKTKFSHEMLATHFTYTFEEKAD